MSAINLSKNAVSAQSWAAAFACRSVKNARINKEITALTQIVLKGAKQQAQSSRIL